MLLETDLGLVQRPADSLKVGAYVEQVTCIWMEAGENSLLADGYAEICALGGRSAIPIPVYVAHLSE